MSLYLYDEALVQKIQSWTANTNVHVYSPSNSRRLFEVLADENNDRPIELPIICLNRKPSFTVNEVGRKPLSYDGMTKEATVMQSLQINSIPITIDYQIDIYTRYLQDADEFTRNIIFNIINFPTVTVNIPYQGENIKHDSYLTMSQEVADNSDIPERLIQGQFTRFTIDVTLQNAYLWDIRLRPNVHIVNTVVEGE